MYHSIVCKFKVGMNFKVSHKFNEHLRNIEIHCIVACVRIFYEFVLKCRMDWHSSASPLMEKELNEEVIKTNDSDYERYLNYILLFTNITACFLFFQCNMNSICL